MKSFSLIIISALLIIQIISLPGHGAPAYQKIQIIGETASSGIYDPSIEYTSDGSIGYMAYTACDNWPLTINTHLAKTTDHGLTWTFVQQINITVPETINVFGTPTTGRWHHETSTLIHDPDDPDKEWKLYWHHHFMREPYNPGTDKIWQYGWVGYKYTANPEGTWSNEIPLFGAEPYPPAPYSVQIDLNALNPRLGNYIVHIEPGGLYYNQTLYLAFQAGNANRDEQIIHLIKSIDHGVNWTFVDVLGDSNTAQALGYDYLSAPSLVQELGQSFLFFCGGYKAPGSNTHDGTHIVKFTDLDAGQLNKVGIGDQLEIYNYLAPISGTFNSGESDYDAFNTAGGIIYPQFVATPPYEFEMWNSFVPLLHTPTATPSASPTPIELLPNTKVIAYPNPSHEEIKFQIASHVNALITIDLYTIAGERVTRLSGKLTNTQELVWDCRSIAPGIYIAVIKENNQKIKTLKVSVVH